MDIRELYYFSQVAKTRSFTQAAKNIHISQPALSKTIKKLEDELNVTLIDRRSNEITLTENGEFLLEKAEEILFLYENLKKSFQENSKVERGKVIIGVPPVIGSSVFARVFSSFRTKYPNIRLRIIENGAKVTEHNLENGVIDIGVVISPIDQNRFKFFPLFTDENVLIVHCEHPLANKESVTFAELEHELFLLLDKSFMLHHQIIANCKENGFTPNIYFESSQWDFLVELVSEGVGVTILPRPILDNFNTDSIKIIPFQDPFAWEVGLIINQDQFVTNAMRIFINYTTSLKWEEE